jgi:hypothetical protein
VSARIVSATRHDPSPSIFNRACIGCVPSVVEDLEIAAPGLRELYSWLGREDELRGRLRLDGRAPRPGEMGSAVDILLVSLAPGGVAAALVAGLFSWLRTRTGAVKATLTRADGSTVEVTATSVRTMQPAELTRAVRELAAELEPDRRPAAGPDAARTREIRG